MRISELLVRNYRNIKEIKITPQRVNGTDLVVLIGENNAGKTNLLSILHQILNPEKSIRTLEFTETDFFDIAEPIYVEIVLDELTDEQKAEFVTVLHVEQDGNGEEIIKLPLTFTCTYDARSKEAVPQLVYSRLPDRNVSFAEKKHISFYFQDALRDYRAIRPTGGTLFSRILKELDINEEEKKIIEKLEEASHILTGNTHVREFTKEVKDVTKKIIHLPDFEDTMRLMVAASTVVDVKRYIRFQIKEQLRGEFLDVDQLGLGLQSVLTMSIFRAFAGLGKVIEGIFAIDEPESHLYPHAQRSMFREIIELSKLRQVWVATHSPTLVEIIDPRQIVLIKKDIQSQSKAFALPQDFPKEHIQSYEKHLDVGKSDAFFAKAVMLVEGPTEQGLFPAMGKVLSSNAFYYDLDLIGVSVINAGGKTNLKTLTRLLKNFDIPCIAVIDFDQSDEAHEQTLKELKEINENVVELPRVPGMGDIEGLVCTHVPIPLLLSFLDNTLPHDRKTELFGALKGELGKFDKEKGEEIKVHRRAGRTLADIFGVIEAVINQHNEAEAIVRKILADSFRKIKGRTTGRLIGEQFTDYLPDVLTDALTLVIKLTGIDVGGGTNGEES